MSDEITIAGRKIGRAHRPYIIAEISANHGGSFDRALELVDAAADAGADAVKLQTYRPDTITLDCDNEHFRLDSGTIWDGETLHSLYEKAYTPWDWHPALGARAIERGIQWFSSPFDRSAVEYLTELDAPAFKIASFELVDTGLIRAVAATGRPVIASTGMATLDEIDEAVSVLKDAGCEQFALLRTNSGYPAAPEEMDLAAIPTLRARYVTPVGLSDHTLTTSAPVAAVALGASIIEKHITISRDIETADREFSLEPDEFRQMVTDVRDAHAAIGSVRFGPSERERASIKYRRSLFVAADIRAGETFTTEHVRSVRPGAGLHTRHLDEIVGRRAASDVDAGTPLSWNLVAEDE